MDFWTTFLLIGVVGIASSVPLELNQHNQSSSEYLYVIPTVETGASDNSAEPKSLNYAEARQFCRQHACHSHLITLDDKYDEESLVAVINGTIAEENLPQFDYLRIDAMFDLTKHWTWVNGHKMTAIYFHGSHWDLHLNAVLYRPKNSGSRLTMYSQHAHVERGYICEFTDKRGNCSFVRNGSCFAIKPYDPYKSTWYRARMGCLDEGGDLASFETLGWSELESYKRYFTLDNEYWIGAQGGIWRWTDTGSEIKYTNWVGGAPRNRSVDCVCLYRPGGWRWVNCDCNTPLPFICAAKVWTLPAIDSHDDQGNSDSESEKLTGEKNQEKLGFGEGVAVGLIIAVAVAFTLALILFLWRRNTRNRSVSSQIFRNRREDDGRATGYDRFTDDSLAADRNSTGNEMSQANLI